MEVLVGWFAWYAKVIAHGVRTNELPAYIALATPESGDPRSSLQLTFSSSSSLHLAFFATHPPPSTLSLHPHCQCGIYRRQRSQATRATISHPMPPLVEISHEGSWMLRWSWFSYISVVIRFSFSYIGYYFNVLVWL